METPPDPQICAALDASYEQLREAAKIPGLVYGWIARGRLVRLRGFGLSDREAARPVGPQTFFRIASLTKLFTALAVLKLRDEGALALETPVADIVPELAVAPGEHSRSVTIRDLLSHVAGLVEDDAWADRLLGDSDSALQEHLRAGLSFARAPGLGFEYSNFGYVLLGCVVARASGERFQDYVRRRLLAPLGMGQSGFDQGALSRHDVATGYGVTEGHLARVAPQPDGAFAAMGGLITNGIDYARFVSFLLAAWAAGESEGETPVRRATRREIALAHAPPVLAHYRLGAERIATASAYGYGLLHTADDKLGRYLQHAGGLPGYGAHMMFVPESGAALFSFANRTYAPMSEANMRAALMLKSAGLWAAAAPVPSRPLSDAVQAVLAAYRAGRIEAAGALLSRNLMQDRSSAEWNSQIAALRARAGAVQEIAVEPRHALAACLLLHCERGEVRGEIWLTPERPPRIQVLRLHLDRLEL